MVTAAEPSDSVSVSSYKLSPTPIKSVQLLLDSVQVLQEVVLSRILPSLARCRSHSSRICRSPASCACRSLSSCPCRSLASCLIIGCI